MYSIDFENLHKAAEIIYCFMTLPALTKPECTLWNDDGFPDTVTNTGKGFMSEEKFCRWIVNSDFAAISCVASTDKEGSRRVVLNLIPGARYMTLNFPMSSGKPSEAEKRLLNILEKYDEHEN